MTEDDNLYLSVTTTAQYAPLRERVYLPIPLEEWERLIERLNSCRISLQLWSAAYSVMFGIAVTAGLSIAPIAASDIPPWVLSVYIAVTSASLASAIVLVIAERSLAKRHASQIDALISDMDRLKNSVVLD